MRTTIRLPDDLYAEAKALAARTGRPVASLIEDALRLMLSSRRDAPRRRRIRLPTMRGNGVRPGVDLDNSAALLDLMDGLDGPR